MLVLALLFANTAQGRGGPPAVFHTDVPDSSLNVIAGVPTARSVKLSVLSKSDEDFQLDIAGSKMQSGHLTGGEPKAVTISNLQPGRAYAYRITSGTNRVEGRFTTARRPGQAFVFDIQADSHLDGNTDPAVYENTLSNEKADQPDFLVDLGDTFMVDKYRDFQDSLKQYQAQRYWFSTIGSQASVFLCLGNHDGETGWVMRGQTGVSDWARSQRQRYFPSVEPNDFYSGAPAKGLYYAWTWGDALLVVLDPFAATVRKPRDESEGWNWTLGKTQFEWLASTLRNSNAKYKFLFIHHLVGGFGKEARGGVEASNRLEWGDDVEFPTMRTGWAEPIHALMKRYKVSALIHGHDHLYVHQERDGIAYLEIPQPSEARGDNTNSAEEYGYKTGKLLGSSGHIRVTLNPSTARFEYVKSRLGSTRNREVVDSFEIKPSHP